MRLFLGMAGSIHKNRCLILPCPALFLQVIGVKPKPLGLERSDPKGRRSQASLFQQPQAVPKVAVSGVEVRFFAGQPVSKVAVSGMEYGFLQASLFQRLLYRERSTAFCLKEAGEV
jgi:hypothetical protein